MKSVSIKTIVAGTGLAWSLLFSGGMVGAEQSLSQEEVTSQKILELSEQVKTLSQQIEKLQQELENADPIPELGAVPGYNPRASYYEVPEGFPKFDGRVRYLGNLRGTWREMAYSTVNGRQI